ncbi:hypothetical protein FKW77_000322 [Venturia effusa]|uniref:NAD-dependent epimerase/dehydratase domain-containing protein n=1 Tax=Venturia effusa TaxID=50376 RepID=A0A517LHV7_9PEZI|nr:hypothetical protein FKW77_000322 [Venturia effusa]
MNAKPIVLLTGATGFVGAHVLSQLLESKYAVLAPVRSESKATFLKAKYPNQVSSGALTFMTIPDLSAPGALDAVLQESNVQYILHIASPFFVSTQDPIKELVEPAVAATKNVLSSAIGSGRALKKVVILSSFASVQHAFDEPRAGYVYTEQDWNPVTLSQASTNGILGYMASKTFAEKAGWEAFESAKERKEILWDLVTFCPPMVYGPPLHEIDVAKGIGGLNTSLQILLGSITKPGKVASPPLPHWVDVRDVALAHVKALAVPAGRSERILLCAGPAYYEDGLTWLRKKGVEGLGDEGDKCDAETWFSIDVSNAEKMLEIEWRDFETCVEDVWKWAETVRLVGQWRVASYPL